MPPETEKTPAEIAIDNPMEAEQKTPAQQEQIKLLEKYHSMIDDKNPQWFALKGAKGSAAKERFRPVNCYPEYSGVTKATDIPKESPVFAVMRLDPPAAFKRKCSEFCEQFEPASPPPSDKK